VLSTTTEPLSLRFRSRFLPVRIWRLPACFRINLPVAVLLNRLLAPLCDFCFISASFAKRDCYLRFYSFCDSRIFLAPGTDSKGSRWVWSLQQPSSAIIRCPIVASFGILAIQAAKVSSAAPAAILLSVAASERVTTVDGSAARDTDAKRSTDRAHRPWILLLMASSLTTSSW
jgi:hypothetical protein